MALTENDLLSTTDAAKWGEEWVRIANEIIEADDGRNILDEGWMISWFANAIETGYNAARNRYANRDHAELDWSSLAAMQRSHAWGVQRGLPKTQVCASCEDTTDSVIRYCPGKDSPSITMIPQTVQNEVLF